MAYYFSKTPDSSFDAAIVRRKAIVKDAGFDIVTEIDIRENSRRRLASTIATTASRSLQSQNGV
ncbi:hypothetical protein EN932_11210 [Mesorhizobium sp. M7A.F.Ca.US.002.01.1.1]|uniref:hypothetical protein n=1 Tax=Mesorhizobium sp. M7A.F.Ca.US.002.01.1.1 TaxID=2496700 RepID=UPI000FD1C5BF|nr:hypothetical protein [Mesorhizobium sp. M7A.F.Ca.US.002.01.1.1]RVA12732.1 hypothetical protein EN932_11210 [Mesorhizobium sp. M7A.F.Ca.US.002.01.1.1]